MQKDRERRGLREENRRRKNGILTKEQIRIINFSNFIQQSNKIHNFKYDYSLVEYKNGNSKVIIICPIHDKFHQLPFAHKTGQGCNECAKIQRPLSKRKSLEKFIQEAQNIHSDFYSYDKSLYQTTHIKICIICPKHGEFLQTPKAHLKGQGCPLCANTLRNNFHKSKGERIIEYFLDNNKIFYEKQKIFKDCKYILPLPFDFYLPHYNLLIEFDGSQHSKFTKKYHKNLEQFEISKKRDHIKTNFAISNGFKFLRISDKPRNKQKYIEEILFNFLFT